MVRLSKAYIKCIRRDHTQWAIWEPNALIEIGTVGRFDGLMFKAGRHMSAWGVPIKTEPSSVPFSSIQATRTRSSWRG